MGWFYKTEEQHEGRANDHVRQAADKEEGYHTMNLTKNNIRNFVYFKLII